MTRTGKKWHPATGAISPAETVLCQVVIVESEPERSNSGIITKTANCWLPKVEFKRDETHTPELLTKGGGCPSFYTRRRGLKIFRAWAGFWGFLSLLWEFTQRGWLHNKTQYDRRLSSGGAGCRATQRFRGNGHQQPAVPWCTVMCAGSATMWTSRRLTSCLRSGWFPWSCCR